MQLVHYMKAKLFKLVIDGTQERYSEGADPRQHVARIYLCARSYREMAALVVERLPNEKLNATLIAVNGTRGWPSIMRWVKPQVGVWVSNRRDAIIVHQVMADGSRVEID